MSFLIKLLSDFHFFLKKMFLTKSEPYKLPYMDCYETSEGGKILVM